MKTILTLVLTLALVVVVSACTDNKGGTTEPAPETTTSGTTLAATNSSDVATTTTTRPTTTTTTRPTESTSSTITADRALALALTHAGVAKADARDVETELDRERGTLVWEVSFEAGGYEYDYDINAATGEVLLVEKEPERR